MPQIPPCVEKEPTKFQRPLACLNESSKIVAVGIFKSEEFNFATASDFEDEAKWTTAITDGIVDNIIAPVAGTLAEPSAEEEEGDGFLNTQTDVIVFDQQFTHKGTEANTDLWDAYNYKYDYTAVFFTKDRKVLVPMDDDFKLLPTSFFARKAGVGKNRRFLVNVKWESKFQLKEFTVPLSVATGKLFDETIAATPPATP